MNEKEEEIKYFVSNAPADVSLDDLLLVAFSRWRVERSFQDTKQKLGLGHYEGRNYQGLIRHLLLCTVTYYFLQTQWFELSKKKRRFDFLSGGLCDGDGLDTACPHITSVKNYRVLSTA